MQKKVMLFTTHGQALEYRKRLSQTGAGAAFGVDATTFDSWLADAWELYGDGRTIASPLDRSFAVRQLLLEAPELSTLKLTDGGISLVCRFLADALGSVQLEKSLVDPPAGLSLQERAVLSLVALYRDSLDARGLVDPGDALRALAPVCPPCSFVLQEGVEPGLPFEDFVQSNCSVLQAASAPALVGPTPDGCRPRFLLSAGPSCQDAQISNYISGLLADARADGAAPHILVCTSRPFAVFEAVSRSLAEGATCSLRASRSFPQTEFGRAFLSVREYLLDPVHDPSTLMDYLASPFSGVSELDAAKVYSQVRGDRTLGFDDLRAMAHLLSPTFDLFEELVSDSDASLLLDRFLDIAEELGVLDAAAAFEQEVAISALRGVYEAARAWGVAPSELSFALQGLTVDASRVCGSSDAQVEVVDASWADRLPEGLYDAVVVCDLDARYWRAGEPHNAIVGLEEKLGIPMQSHVLSDVRRRFEGLKSRAKGVFACQRVLTAGGDEDVYPSFVLDEFCAALCKDPSDELDGFGIPASLADCVAVRNEGGSASTFAANLDFGGEAPSSFSIPGFAPGAVSKESVADLSLYRAPDNPDLLVLSPSAIEEYANCPYRWFASRRLRPQAPDELLGPLEQGVFIHGVLEEFYSRIEGELGVKRVNPENLGDSQVLLGRVFDEALAAQPEVQDNARFIPLSPVERARANRLKQVLARNLAVQAQLMPSFSPLLLECQVKPEQAIDYAGVRVMGRADRVDVDAQRGCFAVIDYKGGISGHEAGMDPDKVEGACLPPKIQALVYAQVFQRGVVDAKPVGALYLSYRASEAKGSVAGSFDDALLDLQGFAGSKSAVKMNFGSYLDMIEDLVREKLERLYEGCIEPNPLGAQSCTYCPVANCDRRVS